MPLSPQTCPRTRCGAGVHDRVARPRGPAVARRACRGEAGDTPRKQVDKVCYRILLDVTPQLSPTALARSSSDTAELVHPDAGHPALERAGQHAVFATDEFFSACVVNPPHPTRLLTRRPEVPRLVRAPEPRAGKSHPGRGRALHPPGPAPRRLDAGSTAVRPRTPASPPASPSSTTRTGSPGDRWERKPRGSQRGAAASRWCWEMDVRPAASTRRLSEGAARCSGPVAAGTAPGRGGP